MKTNAVFSTFTINPVSRTETVLSKPYLSLCIRSFLYRSRRWNISNNKNKITLHQTFYHQWILPQPLLTSIGFRLQHSYLLPAQSRREMKNQKGEEDCIQSPDIFIFSEKSLFYIWAKCQIFPWKSTQKQFIYFHDIKKCCQGSWVSPLVKILWITVLPFIFSDYSWMCLLLFL